MKADAKIKTDGLRHSHHSDVGIERDNVLANRRREPSEAIELNQVLMNR